MYHNALDSVLLRRDFQRCVCDFMAVISGAVRVSFGLEQDIHMSGMPGYKNKDICAPCKKQYRDGGTFI